MDGRDAESRDALRVFIAQMEVASVRVRAAQRALGSSMLDCRLGYEDISAQCSYALSQTEAALEGASRKLEELEPQSRG